MSPQVKHVPIIARATTIVVAMRSALKVNQSIGCSKTLRSAEKNGLRETPTARGQLETMEKVSVPTGRG